MLAEKLLQLLLALFLVSVTWAEKRTSPVWMFNKIFAGSEKPLLMQSFAASEKKAHDALKTLLDYYKNMASSMTHPGSSDDFQTLDVANLPTFLTYYGWPEMNKTQRLYFPRPPVKPRNPSRRTPAELADVQRYKRDKDRFAETERTVFKALATIGHALDSPASSKRVLDFIARSKGRTDVVQWGGVYHNNRVNYTTESNTHRCRLRSNIAYRINGTWSVGAMVTNDRAGANLPEGKRIFLAEFLTLGPSGAVGYQPLYFDLNFRTHSRKYWLDQPWAVNASANVTRTAAASTISEFGGQVGIYFFNDFPVADNIAFVAALADSQVLTRQARDASTPSNTAILVFPILMAAVPVALFADVGNLTALGYMVFTDFLAVLPLGIKGAELLAAGLNEYFSTRSKVLGDLASDRTVVAMTWSCRCESALDLTRFGAAFIALAVLATVAGVTLEFVAKAQLERNNRSAKHALALAECAGIGVEYVWERHVACIECDCARKDAVHGPTMGGGLIGQMQRRRREASRRREMHERFRARP